VTATADRIRALLPRGVTLSEVAFSARHRGIVVILALHIPLLTAVGAVYGAAGGTLAAALTPLLALVAIAAAPLRRLPRMIAATVGLSYASALAVHLTDGLIEAHFHYFFALALIALYQDWRPYLVAIAGVVLHHGMAGALAPGAVFNHGDAILHPWRWAIIHGVFVLAVAVTQLAFWRATEAEQATSRELWHQLYEGERAVVRQLQSAEAVKTELLSVVSHEFRTPLTSIIGFSHTLMARADDLDPATIRLCVRNIDQQSRRLARLVHNVLAASGDVATDPTAVTDLASAARDIAREVGDAYDLDAPRIEIGGVPTLRARIDAEAADRVLLNILDNAVKFGVPGSAVHVALGADERSALVEVSNVASPIAAAQLERIFQPFTQADSSDSRAADGIGLGLHVVRRTLDALGGDIAVHHRDGRVVFVARIPLAGRPSVIGDLRIEAGAEGLPR
jgi:signal transduction histidine kinase